MLIEMKGKIPIYGGEKKLVIDYYKRRIREEAPKESLLLFEICKNEISDKGWLAVDGVQVARVKDEVKMALIVKNGKIYIYEIDTKGVFWWYEW